MGCGGLEARDIRASGAACSLFLVSNLGYLDVVTEYWRECITEAFLEAGIQASAKQIDIVAEIVMDAEEVYGEMHLFGKVQDPLCTVEPEEFSPGRKVRI